MTHTSNNQAFSTIEMLLSISIVALLAGISIPIYNALRLRNDLEIATFTIAGTIRRAEHLAQAVDGDTSWGVFVEDGSITLFKGLFNGASFSSRDANFDEVYEIARSITISGLTEIILLKFSGEPLAIGTITLTSSTQETRVITVNEKGMVAY